MPLSLTYRSRNVNNLKEEFLVLTVTLAAVVIVIVKMEITGVLILRKLRMTSIMQQFKPVQGVIV